MNGCGQLGAIQTQGTCWFYSILNGFLLSENGQKILYMQFQKFYNSLTANEKAWFDDGHNAPCPMKSMVKTKDIYFWKFFDQYACFASGPRAASLKTGKSAKILADVNLAGTVAKNKGGVTGAYPQVELPKILDHIGFAGKYDIRASDTSSKFDPRKKSQFAIVVRNKRYTKEYMFTFPDAFLQEKNYELMCATILIANTEASNAQLHKWHAITGFVCNGDGYLFDSNQRKIFKCKWWDKDDLWRVVYAEVGEFYSFFKNHQVNYVGYALVVFSRKEFTKLISPTCRMKYKTKTPNLGLSNSFFTDPESGKVINTRFPQLNPAQRMALKRKWARTEHKAQTYINKATFNSILAEAKNKPNGLQQVTNLVNAGYKYKNENYHIFSVKLKAKFPVKAVPTKTYTFADAKAHLNKFTTSSKAVRKHQYSLVWKDIPIAQRKVLMRWRETGNWLANNTFEKKRKSPIKKKTPSPSPRTTRTTQLKTNFEKYWKTLQPNNRKMLRNYIATTKTPSPPKPKPKSPSPVKYTLTNAKRNVNTLTTAKARKEFYGKGTVGKGLTPTNLVELSKYIRAKNQAAKNARAAKKSVAKK